MKKKIGNLLTLYRGKKVCVFFKVYEGMFKVNKEKFLIIADNIEDADKIIKMTIKEIKGLAEDVDIKELKGFPYDLSYLKEYNNYKFIVL